MYSHPTFLSVCLSQKSRTTKATNISMVKYTLKHVNFFKFPIFSRILAMSLILCNKLSPYFVHQNPNLFVYPYLYETFIVRNQNFDLFLYNCFLNFFHHHFFDQNILCCSVYICSASYDHKEVINANLLMTFINL